MSEDIKNAASFGEMPIEKRVENLYQGAFESIESLDNLFKKGGFLEMSVEKLGGEILGCSFIINLRDLGGSKKLEKMGISTHFLCEFEGV